MRALPLHLAQRALSRRLVRAPAQKARAVAEAIAAEMVVTDLDHELGSERLPFGRAFRRPAAGTARRLPGESWRRDEALELLGQRLAFRGFDVRGEADVMQQTGLVVEAEQERADDVRAFAVAEAPDDAIGAAEILDLLHRRAVGGPVLDVATLGDTAVQSAGAAFEPALGLGGVGGDGRELDRAVPFELPPRERFEPLAALLERQREQGTAVFRREQVENDEAGRGLGRQFLHPARRRMDPLQQRVEIIGIA